jgi:cystathionine beta-lyase
MDISNIINHLGEERNQYFNAISPVQLNTSNFCFTNVQEMRGKLDMEFEVPFYTRGNNPTVAILRKKIAALELAEDALITSSGCAAISTAVISNLESGDHVVCVKDVYSWTEVLFSKILAKFNIETTFVDGCKTKEVFNAIKSNTKMIYLESPTSFTFNLQDIKSIAKFAKGNNIVTIIDNSYSSPIYQQPIKLGIDIVVHSATKYINGHSDVVAGVICSNSTMIKKIFSTEWMTLGGIVSAENAWLMLRGLRTLPIRMKQISDNAIKVISFLEKHPKIEKVIYPFSNSHSQYKLAKQQMTGSGGLYSIILKTNDINKVDSFCNSLKRFLIACSWGGYESLVFPASVFYSAHKNNIKTIPFNMIRIYVGLEEADLLIEDIDLALNSI